MLPTLETDPCPARGVNYVVRGSARDPSRGNELPKSVDFSLDAFFIGFATVYAVASSANSTVVQTSGLAAGQESLRVGRIGSRLPDIVEIEQPGKLGHRAEVTFRELLL